MMRFNPIKYGVFWACLLLLTACGSKRYLERTRNTEKGPRWTYQEHLVVKNRISMEKQNYPITDKSDLEDKLEDLVLQEPNEKLLAFRFRLWVHNVFRRAEEEQKLRNWLKTRIGEKPTLYNSDRTIRTANSMRYFLNSRAYFNAEVRVDTVFKRHKALVTYHIRPGRPLTIDSVFYRSADPQMRALLDSTAGQSYLKPGVPIRKNTFLNEKSRLLLQIRNSGYQEFNLNYIYFEADTTGKSLDQAPKRNATPKANVYVHILPRKDSLPHQAYRINDVYIYPNEELSLLGENTDSLGRDTQFYKGVHIVRWKYKGVFLRNNTLRNAITFQPKMLYHYSNYRETLVRLSELDVFIPPDVDFVPVKGDTGLLDVHIRMQAAKKMVAGADFDMNTDNSNLGGAVNLLFRHRNVFKGGEVFMFNVEGGADFVLGGAAQNIGDEEQGLARWINMVDLNGEMRLYFPKYIGIVPNFDSLLRMENTRSRVTLGARYLQQSTDFSVRSFSARYGYEWNKNRWHSFTFNPVLVNITLEPRLSNTFRSDLQANNPALLLSLQERFVIFGLDFSHTYSSAAERQKKWIWSIRSNFESAGVALAGLDALSQPEQDFRPFNINYSEYLRVETDVRLAYLFGEKHSFASRLFVGSAFSLDPERRIPFSRRFFLGGPNSMRAWQMRTLGPGTVRPVDNAAFQLGDFRLEANVEYRFKLGGYFEGALFVDAGNIWDLRLRETPAPIAPPQALPPDGLLQWDFLSELALNSGLGLRIDLDFIILRLDWAIQLRSPYPYGFDELGFARYWNWQPFVFRQRNNLVLGVGYPF